MSEIPGTPSGPGSQASPEPPATAPQPDISSGEDADAGAPGPAGGFEPALDREAAREPAHRDAPSHHEEPIDREEPADRDEPTPPLERILEAILLVVDEPVSDGQLAQVTEQPRVRVAAALEALAADYAAGGRGFELRNVAGGWRLYTAADCAAYVERFVLEGQQARLTQAALETLAVVAYRQPVSRQAIAAIRGVNVDGVVRTLLTRGLVAEVGEDPSTGAHLYGTTPYFLERLGVTSLDDLPGLAPLLPTSLDDIDAS